MTRVDFYIVESGRQDALRVACRIAEKAYLDQLRVCVRAASPQQATQLDRLMWLFRDGSFVPHRYVENPSEEAEEPVVIACGDTEWLEGDILITQQIVQTFKTWHKSREGDIHLGGVHDLLLRGIE